MSVSKTSSSDKNLSVPLVLGVGIAAAVGIYFFLKYTQSGITGSEPRGLEDRNLRVQPRNPQQEPSVGSSSVRTATPLRGLASRGLKIIQMDGSPQLVRRDPADQEIQHLTFPQGRLIVDSYRKTLLQLKNNIIDILSYGEKGTALVDTILPAFRESYFFAQKQVDAFVDEMIHEHGKDTAIVSLQQQHKKVLAILKNEGTTHIENDRRMKAYYDYIELVIHEMETDDNSMEDGAKERVRPSGIYGLFLELFLLGKLSIPPIALSGVPGDEPGERLGDYDNHTESSITTPVVVMPSLSFFDQDGNIQSPVVMKGLALVPK